MTGPPPPLEGAALLAHPISEAVMATVWERGYPEARVEEFVARAGVSQAEFDLHFSDKGEAALRIFEAYIDDFVDRVGAAYSGGGPWPGSLRAAAYETARWVLAHPAVAWFGTAGVLEAGDMARARRDRVFRWAASLIDAGRAAAPDPDAIPRSAALIAVGGIAEAVRRRQEGAVGIDVAEALQRMMYLAVRPYLGEEAARAELEIEPPQNLRARGDG
ncbi:MAG TPA: TetR/AcrR family transcriptional regulator [Solirubrobacterales bacterium]|nr:TetR/AcrR family transcriptional regulator [Solirubrobacterales bacterium]